MIGPIAKRLHQNLTPFDPTDVVFHFDANAGNTLVINLLDSGERPVAGFLLRLLKRHPLWGKALKSRILPQRTAVGERQVLRIRNGLVMFLTFIGVTQVAHLAPTVMNHPVLDAMRFTLATGVPFAVSFVFGAIDPTFSAIDDEL